MAVDIHSDEGRTIRQLIPLSTLPSQVFAQLCSQLEVEYAERGQALFKRGDEDSRLYYLLNGSINLQVDALKIETIEAGTDSARFALAHQIPRKVDAIAANKIQFLTMDVNIIKSIQDTTYDENEQDMIVEEMEEDSDDWMTTLLRSPIFRNLPPANLQKLLISLEEVNFKAGEVIIEQGEQGNYYYIIKKGQALISRKPSPSAKEIKLARLGDLDSFGEDALISGEPRNVTITAMTEMTLLRLAKDQFIALIKQPSLKYIDYSEMMEYVDKGADLIDVRGPDEYKRYHLPHSVSVPFFSLRMYLKTLNRQHPIIVVCKNGRTSEAAAFVLLRHKFTALILQGGLDALDQELLKSPASFAIDDGVETGNFTEAATEIKLDESSEHQEVAVKEDEDANEEALRGTIESLTIRCQTLEAEKAALEIKCASMRRHLESMKAEIDRLKNAAS